jgi:nucleotide-binding universal stress UspA family protein
MSRPESAASVVTQIERRFGPLLSQRPARAAGDASPSQRPIVLCYDGSSDARHAIRRAGEMFLGHSALVITVWQPTGGLGTFVWAGETVGMVDFEALDNAVAEESIRIAREGTSIAQEVGLSAQSLVVKAGGPVWKAILEVAERRDATTIVMGSRGLTGLRSLLLGSVSSAVVHHTARPTLVIPPPRLDA